MRQSRAQRIADYWNEDNWRGQVADNDGYWNDGPFVGSSFGPVPYSPYGIPAPYVPFYQGWGLGPEFFPYENSWNYPFWNTAYNSPARDGTIANQEVKRATDAAVSEEMRMAQLQAKESTSWISVLVLIVAIVLIAIIAYAIYLKLKQ